MPSSETLFGALSWGIRTLYSEEDLLAILNNFDTSPKKFIPSSAFPLLKSKNGNGSLYCYPKVILPDPKIEEMEEIASNYKSKTRDEIPNKLQFSKRDVISQYKGFKEIKYLSETLFNRLVSGEKITKLYCEYLDKKLKIIGGGILLTDEEVNKIEKEKIIEQRTSARNKIDRLSFSTVPSGEIYYEEEISLNPEVFQLYFLLLTEEIDFFVPILCWLEDTGIGGNRTVGRGHYDIKLGGEVTLPNATDTNLFISLSKYLPADAEIDWQSENNYYELLPYQPRFDTMFFKGGEFIKNRIIYLSEGSIFQAKERKEYYGRLHPSAKFQNQTIYQCGLTIPVFTKVEGQ